MRAERIKDNMAIRDTYNIVGIIQARMGSSRLPGKMIADLCGYPVLQWVIERCKRSSTLSKIVLATTTNSEDDCLITLSQSLGIYTFRGSEQDVLDRFIRAAKNFDATTVVRICADNPLVAPEEIDRLVEFYLKELPDYAFNHIPRLHNNYPDGLGAEILSTEILKTIGRSAKDKKYREHVTLYLWENSEYFNIRTLSCPEPYNHPEMKLDIDTFEDLSLVQKICKNLSFESTPTEIFREWSFLRNKDK